MPTKAELEKEIKILQEVLKVFGIQEDKSLPLEMLGNKNVPVNTPRGLTYRIGDRIFVRFYGGVR